MPSPRLKDKVALVAGAGSVVPGEWSNGRATSVLFAREGARVFAVDLTMEAAQETAALIRGEGGACTPFAADVSRASDVRAMVAACLAAYGGRIDVLFNNVGVQALGGPEEVSEADWDRLMTVNVKPMYLACREVLPVMVRQGGGGAIVNNSSLASRRFLYPSVAYAASKGAVNQLTQNIAVQYAPKGVRANAILPGLIATPRITKRLQDVHGDAYESELRARDRLVPMGRMGDAWDVAHAALFLASDESRYITGVELLVDGGLAASGIGRPWG
ncbi:MAG TPA: SDR family oxidoreductase [Geminicoccaceae bacterium]|nr:SDR family oxidoreductase [Geminicoccaceae bacterium]